jgi:lipid II:glycine glycyltransferase (peptidoglycan interpeptide bridge formation enzyme)
LDLRPPWEKLFAAFHKDCVRRKIRRAEREKLRYEEGASQSLLQNFYRLQVKTRRRQGLPPQPKAWFRGLIASFGKDLKIRVASKGDVPVASILTLSFKKSMVYKYGCSDAAYHNLGGTALLFSRAIQEAKESGFEEFEMGRSDLRNAGLIAFKEHWGAQGTTIRYWRYPAGPASPPDLWKMKWARRVVPFVPDFALVTTGKLLYRHIG